MPIGQFMTIMIFDIVRVTFLPVNDGKDTEVSNTGGAQLGRTCT